MSKNLSTNKNSLVIGCVTEPIPKYLQQASRLLLSLRWLGGSVSDVPFVLCTTGKLSAETESFFKKHGATIVLIERFSQEHGPSNKIRFFELSLLDEWDQILLLDCDTVIVQDPSQFLYTTGLSAKIADAPTVTSSQFQDLFPVFELDMPLEDYVHDVDGSKCISYFNSGVILLNKAWREKFVNAWSYYNNAVIKKWDVLNINKFFTDQVSLTLAVNAISIPLSPLHSAMNLGCHFPAKRYPNEFYDIDPIIIHYHGLFDENGYIKKSVLDQTNLRIDSFNSRLRAEKMSMPALSSIGLGARRTMGEPSIPKVVVGSGWWCDNEESEWHIGCNATRSIPFFTLWFNQVVKCLSPHKIVVTDSHSPLKPDYNAYDLIQWIELDENYGHANDIRTGKVNTKYSGFTRSVLLGCMYALNCDADYFVYVEQDCLIKGEDFLKRAIGDSKQDILIGMPTKEGRGLNGNKAASMKQQSLMIVSRSGMERFLSGLLCADWSDGDVSPEVTMERQLCPLDTISIPYGRSRPIDFDQTCFYAQHFSADELDQFVQLEGLTDLWQQLCEKHYFELL